MSPLAEAVYDVLRTRPGRADPRITYAELAAAVREASAELEHVHHRNRQLYAALGEVEDACRRLGLPSLAALVVAGAADEEREEVTRVVAGAGAEVVTAPAEVGAGTEVGAGPEPGAVGVPVAVWVEDT